MRHLVRAKRIPGTWEDDDSDERKSCDAEPCGPCRRTRRALVDGRASAEEMDRQRLEHQGQRTPGDELEMEQVPGRELDRGISRDVHETNQHEKRGTQTATA